MLQEIPVDPLPPAWGRHNSAGHELKSDAVDFPRVFYRVAAGTATSACGVLSNSPSPLWPSVLPAAECGRNLAQLPHVGVGHRQVRRPEVLDHAFPSISLWIIHHQAELQKRLVRAGPHRIRKNLRFVKAVIEIDVNATNLEPNYGPKRCRICGESSIPGQKHNRNTRWSLAPPLRWARVFWRNKKPVPATHSAAFHLDRFHLPQT